MLFQITCFVSCCLQNVSAGYVLIGRNKGRDLTEVNHRQALIDSNYFSGFCSLWLATFTVLTCSPCLCVDLLGLIPLCLPAKHCR